MTRHSSDESFKVKLDEDLSPMVGEPLTAAGYDVATVAGQGWSGLRDGELWPRLVSEKVYFITADSGFGNIRDFPPGTHHGILVLKPDRESLVTFRDLVAQILHQHSLESLSGAITVARFGKIRVRREPMTGSEQG